MEGLVLYLGPWLCMLAMIACAVGMIAVAAIGGTVNLLVRALRR